MQEASAGAPPPGGCDVSTPHVQESDDEEISSDTDMGFVGSLQPSKEDHVAELLIQQLGGSSRFVREQRQTARRLVSWYLGYIIRHGSRKRSWRASGNT